MAQTYRDPSGRAKWLMRLIAIDMALTGVLLVDSLFIMARPQFFDTADDRYVWLIASAAGLGILFAIITAIAWIVWMLRCYDNVVALGEANEYSKPWAIFGWIIPIGSLWIPFHMTRDLAVDPDPNVHHREEWPLLRWWWGIFILLEYVSRFAFRLWRADGYVDEWPFLIEGILGVAVAPLAILVVAEVTRRQTARHAAFPQLSGEGTLTELGPVPEPAAPLQGSWRLATGVTVGAMVLTAGVGLSPFLDTSTSEVTIVDEVSLGDCTLTEAALSATVVDCSEPHLLQVLGTIDILDPTLPERSLTVEFASGRCWQLFEQNTGISGFSDEYRLRILSPSAESWSLGDRSAHCVVSSMTDSPELVGDLINPSDRVLWTEMEAGGCYSFDSDFLTVRTTTCAAADLAIEAIADEPRDRLVATPFPGDDALAERAAIACGDLAEWYYPDEELWRQGDRIIVCSTPRTSRDA